MAKLGRFNLERATPASAGVSSTLRNDLDRRRPIEPSVVKPVFLHGLWRSGSTFLWSRFRDVPETVCFYEPLHHGLAKLTHARIFRDDAETVRTNRHPELSSPYFAEFAPLVDGRGVRHYRRELAYDRFALDPAEAHPRLEAYIASLIDHAATLDGRAVLGFNRTGLRISWLRAHFDAHHIHIDRDPVGIWASYRSEADNGNFAFFSMWLSVLERNAHHPLLAPLHDRLGLHRLTSASLSSPKDRKRQIIETMRDAESYFMVFYLWMVCTRHAVNHCDIILETSRADESVYRRQAEEDIEALTGCRLDLSRMRSPQARAKLSEATRETIERAAMAAIPQAVKSDLTVWSPSRARSTSETAQRDCVPA